MEKNGFPGQYPFTRGVQPTMYRSRLWTMRAYAGFATAEETNARYKYLLQAGQTGLSVAMDLPTQIGLDSDAELSHGEVGKVGVAIDSLADMERLFEGIPLDKVSTSMTINGPAAVLLAMYVAVAENKESGPKCCAAPSKRYPEGVHRPRHIHLPSAPVHAPHYGYLRVLLQEHPQVEYHQCRRLSYP